MGYFVCLITENPKQIEDRSSYPEISLMFYCDLKNKEMIKATIAQILSHGITLCAIISFTDPYCGLAAKLAEEYNVKKFTSEAILKMENKLKSRDLLKETKYNPDYEIINQDNYKTYEPQINFPLVLKYFQSSGSKDVYYCIDKENYQKYLEKLFSTYPGGTVLLEEYLNGPQYIVEALVIDKKVDIVAIINQEINLHSDHFIVTGYSLQLNYSIEFFDDLKNAVNEIIENHGYENGPCHLEMRNVDGQWKLIEINPRISGAGMNQMLYFGLGINLVEETLKLALNLNVNLWPKFLRNIFAEYVVINDYGFLERITGKQLILNSPGVQYVYVKPKKGTYLSPPTSLGGRYAYIIASGKTKEKARDNAKNAAAKITFHLYQ